MRPGRQTDSQRQSSCLDLQCAKCRQSHAPKVEISKRHGKSRGKQTNKQINKTHRTRKQRHIVSGIVCQDVSGSRQGVPMYIHTGEKPPHTIKPSNLPGRQTKTENFTSRKNVWLSCRHFAVEVQSIFHQSNGVCHFLRNFRGVSW